MEFEANSNNKIYVANLPLQVDDEKLRLFFGQFGEVVDLKIIKHAGTGRSKGFGFITFSRAEDADRMKAADVMLLGRKLKVFNAFRKQKDVFTSFHNGTTFYHYPTEPQTFPLPVLPGLPAYPEPYPPGPMGYPALTEAPYEYQEFVPPLPYNGMGNGYLPEPLVYPEMMLSNVPALQYLCLASISNCLHTKRQCFTYERFKAQTSPHVRSLLLRYLSEDPQASKNIANETLRAICFQLEELEVPVMQQISQSTIKEVIVACPGLISLNMSGYWKVSAASLCEILKHCSQLKYLNLSGCLQVNNEVLENIANSCKGLKILEISQCTKVTDKSLKQVAASCTLLESVAIRSCRKITDASLKALSQNSNISSLDVSWLMITDNSAKWISHCKSLTSLSLNWCIQMSESSIQAIISNCPQLVSLGLRRCKVSNKVCMEIANCCPNLTALDVGFCSQITNGGIFALKEHCFALVNINISGCNLTDRVGNALSPNMLGGMQRVKIRKCKNVGNALLPALALNRHFLVKLDLACDNLTTHGVVDHLLLGNMFPLLSSLSLRVSPVFNENRIDQLVHNCPSLTKIDLSGWPLNDEDLELITTTFRFQLESLSIKDCIKLTEKGVRSISECQNIQKLYLRGVEVTDVSIKEIATKCNKLKRLDISKCKRISSKSIDVLGHECPRLQVLKLRGCTLLNDKIVKSIGEIGTLPNLRTLDIVGCKEISKNGINWFKQKRPFTQIIHDDLHPMQYVIFKVKQNSSAIWNSWCNVHDYSALGNQVPPDLIRKITRWTQRYQTLHEESSNFGFWDEGHGLAVELKYFLGDEVEVIDFHNGHLTIT